MDARQSLVFRFRTVTGLAETTTIRDHAESSAWPVLRVGGGKEGRRCWVERDRSAPRPLWMEGDRS
jgi:hypothetical protein